MLNDCVIYYFYSVTSLLSVLLRSLVFYLTLNCHSFYYQFCIYSSYLNKLSVVVRLDLKKFNLSENLAHD